MSKSTTKKVSSTLMNEIVEVSKTMGEEISPKLLERLRDENLVSSNTREISSLKIKDKDGVLYSVTLSFKTTEKGHRINRSDEMDELVKEFNVLKKRFCEEVTTSILYKVKEEK
jgi:hypothetical protein